MKSTPEKPNNLFSRSFVLHIHPKKVASETLRFTLSFGLGGMAATLLLLLFTSGIFQILSYNYDAGSAYNSIRSMYENTSFGGWTRNIHYWSGNLLVIVTFLHCCRVFLTGAITGSRKINWLTGLLLLTLVLFANFTGYLLPWDQLAFWAVTIFTNMLGYIPLIGDGIVKLLRGGNDIGPATLSIFYAIHTGFLPFCFFILVFYHFWLVRKAGGLVRRQNNGTRHTTFRPTVPDLIVREAATGFILIAAVLLFAALVDAPLDEMANPGMSPNPAKAAWFFLGFQELLMHVHPTSAILVLPSLVILCSIVLPFWQDASLTPGYWFDGSSGGKKLALCALLAGILLPLGAIFLDEAVKSSATQVATDSLNRGIIPVAAILLFYGAGYFLLAVKLKFSRAQAVMAGFLFTVSSVCTLTVVAIWLRGPGMKLILSL